MGQRLVITIQKDDKRLCNIYYHWSGYTYDALEETKAVIDCIYNHKDETEKEMLLRLIHFCEKNGGGISGGCDSNEWNYIQTLYPNETFKSEGISRNYGLISLSETEMNNSEYWSEGDVYINLDNDSVDFTVFWACENEKEYIEDRKSWDDNFDESKLKDIPTFDFSLENFNVNDIDYIINSLNNTDFDNIIKCKDGICEFIC